MLRTSLTHREFALSVSKMLLGWILKKSHIYLESFCGAYHEFSVSVAHIKLHSLLSEEAERRRAAPCFVLGHVQEVDFFFFKSLSVLQ